jgi:chemotaxis regulatin CheY-phosphate phosphatase CheZ
MGGLVNEPAFRDREPLWSRDASQNPHKEPNMSEPNLAEIQAKLSAVEKENQELKAKLASSEQDQTVKAKDAEITELRGRIVKFEEVVKQHAAERAKAHVDAAIKAKRLPPQATEVHAKWQKLIEQDPANVALIESLPEVDPTGAVVKAGNASGAGAAHKSTEDRWNTATVAQ